ncbi:hypothetical protein MRX96_049028 [Rhipicephalus microplus]
MVRLCVYDVVKDCVHTDCIFSSFLRAFIIESFQNIIATYTKAVVDYAHFHGATVWDIIHGREVPLKQWKLYERLDELLSALAYKPDFEMIEPVNVLEALQSTFTMAKTIGHKCSPTAALS